MDRYSILDQSSPTPPKPAAAQVESHAPWQPQEPVRFPAEDGGKSLAATARGDLHAALQLLAERAKYITGAMAATVGLYENDELMCRACTGAPRQKVGARMRVGSGLAGESARTRRILRCHDTSGDLRVNVETCQKYGISSAVVMPLVRGQQVIGVFELLSGNAQAFDEKDLTALERLGEMVETAIEQAEQPAQESTETTFFDEAPPDAEVAVMPLKLDPEPSPADGKAHAPVHQGEHGEVPLLERGNIGSCKACGFPVSGRRRLCVDCEAVQPSDASTPDEAPEAPAFIAHLDEEIQAKSTAKKSHAFTLLAAVLALGTAAMLVWLRYPNALDWIMQQTKLLHR
jgi:putative methionine-R-sulfoxide reductase with GAF domain